MYVVTVSGGSAISQEHSGGDDTLLLNGVPGDLSIVDKSARIGFETERRSDQVEIHFNLSGDGSITFQTEEGAAIIAQIESGRLFVHVADSESATKIEQDPEQQEQVTH